MTLQQVLSHQAHLVMPPCFIKNKQKKTAFLSIVKFSLGACHDGKLVTTVPINKIKTGGILNMLFYLNN